MDRSGMGWYRRGTFMAMLMAAAVLSAGPAAAGAQDSVNGAVHFVQDLADRAITTLTEDGISEEEREQRTRALLREGFAVHGIARFVLGRYWRSASEADRAEYLTLFEEVVVSVSAARVKRYSGQKFEITGATPLRSARKDESAALVHTTFYANEDSPIRLDWRVANRGEIFKITDVMFEGVSMATTYRDEFTSVVRREGLDGLLQDLREMRDQLDT
ncbi:MAG: phospholipid-binding protein MlaC, partial [Alphaproteobacteria bacterium]